MKGLMTASSSVRNVRSVSQPCLLVQGSRSYAQNPISRTSVNPSTLQDGQKKVSSLSPSSPRRPFEGTERVCPSQSRAWAEDSLAECNKRVPDDRSSTNAEQRLRDIEREGTETGSC